MPQGGNLWVCTKLNLPDDAIQVTVRDDGCGIPPEILSRLFEPFLTTKETGRGVGLGLAISRSILERHNGNIEVQSEVGRGTTFTVTLPWDGESESPPASETAVASTGRG
jgi:signal transduction histidine kinase